MLRMFLIFRSIGKKLLTSQSKTPTTIMTIRIDNNGIIKFFKLDYKITLVNVSFYYTNRQINYTIYTFLKGTIMC